MTRNTAMASVALGVGAGLAVCLAVFLVAAAVMPAKPTAGDAGQVQPTITPADIESPPGSILLGDADQAEQGVIRAKAFIVEDDSGRTRARLDESGLTLIDSKGKMRARIFVQEFVQENERTSTVKLQLFNGTKASEIFGNMMPEPTFSVSVDDIGYALLSINGPYRVNKKIPLGEHVLDVVSYSPSIDLLVGGNTASLLVSDSTAATRVSIGVNEDGPSLSISDAQGKNRAVLGVNQTVVAEGPRRGQETKTPESALYLYGADGHVLWFAP